jgi:hypothetical protein
MSVIRPCGVERRTTYTVGGFVERVELHSATALVESYAYAAYDALGNPGQIVSTDANGPATTSVGRSWGTPMMRGTAAPNHDSLLRVRRPRLGGLHARACAKCSTTTAAWCS